MFELGVIKNNKKVEGAFVWVENNINRLNKQHLVSGKLVIKNKVKSINRLRLVRKGDQVKYKDVSILPERCKAEDILTITGFKDSGEINTDKDLNTFDSTDYSHFVKYDAIEERDKFWNATIDHYNSLIDNYKKNNS